MNNKLHFEPKNLTGKISHHPTYVSEKCQRMINNLLNVMNIQEGRVTGFEDESLGSLKDTKAYIDMFIKDYVTEKQQVETLIEIEEKQLGKN